MKEADAVVSVGIPDAGALFQLFRGGRPLAKSDVQQATGLGRTAVAVRIDALVTAGFLAPSGDTQSQGGRPAALLTLDHRSRVVVGVDIGATHALVALCSIAGEILCTRRDHWDAMRDPESVLGWVVDATRSCLEELAVSADAVLGLGIGLPARVDFAAGRPLSPVLMPGWDAYDVPAFFRERLTPNVLVDNDVNLLAVNERAVTWPDADDLLYVKLSTGLGGGLIMGGEVQRGASGTAGDIGHIRIRTPGAPGDAPQESIAIGEYADGRRLIRTLADEGFEVSSVEDIVGLVRRGEPRVLELLRQIGRVLGEVLASLVDVLNPAVIVLGGRLGNEGEHLLAGVRDSVYRLSLPAATQNLQIVQSRAGEFGAALGAARLILEDALSPAKVAAAVAG